MRLRRTPKPQPGGPAVNWDMGVVFLDHFPSEVRLDVAGLGRSVHEAQDRLQIAEDG